MTRVSTIEQLRALAQGQASLTYPGPAVFTTMGNGHVRADVVVYRAAGERGSVPFAGSAVLEEYWSDGPAWAGDDPLGVLAACAEAEAIRRAVPGLAGVYLDAEPAELLEAAAREATVS